MRGTRAARADKPSTSTRIPSTRTAAAGEIAAQSAQRCVVLGGRHHVGARLARDDVALDEVADVVVDEAELIARQRSQRLGQANRARCCAARRARTPATARATSMPAARTTARRIRRGSPEENERCAVRPRSRPRRRAAGRSSSRAALTRLRRTTESMKPRSVIVVGARD